MVSGNKQIILKDAFNEIGTCKTVIKRRRIALKDGWKSNVALFFEVNLFKEVWFLNLILNRTLSTYL